MRKHQQLHRARLLASAILCAALALLAISSHFASGRPWLAWVEAFAEAAAVGGIADWYAVVALFRRPFGLPIPHTAIIPQNKNAIGDGLGEFVAEHLLTPENVAAKLGRFDIAGRAAAWLAVPANAEGVAATLLGFVPAFLRAPDDADLRGFFEAHVTPQLLRLDVARFAARCLELLADTGLQREGLDRGLEAFERWLGANEETIRARFAKASRFTPAPLDAYIVKKFMEGIRGLIREVTADPAHPIRGQVDAALAAFVRNLDQSPRHRDAVRARLRAVLDRYAADAGIRVFRERLAGRIAADLARTDSTLRRSGAAFLTAVARGILNDAAVLGRLNGALVRFVRSLTAEHRREIAMLIAEVVKGWDASEVSRKIELAIGKDLQYIRINGALVGGVAGIVLHACMVL
jgi:uncharacterized membrane-anchored protein YjiN (DUF445 family)